MNGSSSLPRFRSLALTLIVLASGAAASSGGPAEASTRPSVAAYRGLGAWVDIYDLRLWSDPEGVVASMHTHGVRTLFLETGNWRIDQKIFEPAVVARFVNAAHSSGLDIVAWYVPDFRNLDRDFARALAATRFVTSSGERFDSFGLDIESSEVRDPTVRTSRMLSLSTRIRQAMGSSYTLAAIVPSPYAMQLIPTYWPGFPFGQLAGLYDVFLPMGYFTYRTNGPSEAAAYTNAAVGQLAQRTGGAPIHAIGGLAENTSGPEVLAFVRAAIGQGVIGASLYDFGTTGSEDWAALAAVNDLVPKPKPQPKQTPKPSPSAAPSPPAVRDAPPLIPWSLNRSHFLPR